MYNDDKPAVKVLSLLISFFLIMILLVAKFDQTRRNNKINEIENQKYVYMDLQDYVVIDKTTKIAYIKFKYDVYPYYSENGKLQKYENGKLVEIKGDD